MSTAAPRRAATFYDSHGRLRAADGKFLGSDEWVRCAVQRDGRVVVERRRMAHEEEPEETGGWIVPVIFALYGLGILAVAAVIVVLLVTRP